MSPPGHASAPPLLRVQDLTLRLGPQGRTVVQRFNVELQPGERVGIVGESGSGKTLVARALLGLEPPAIQRAGGSIEIQGRRLDQMEPAALRALRGGVAGMVFQEPMTSLNPALRIGTQLEEGLIRHTRLSAPQRRARMLEMLQRIGLQQPEAALRAYPHEFSGGMRQRIMLAAVMLLAPPLLIADEPTTALDAVVQKEVLDLMLSLARDQGTALLLISHDLAMVARYTQRVLVMCQGEIVESGATTEVLSQPAHAYTRRLLAAMPRRQPARPLPRAEPLLQVQGLVVEYGGGSGRGGRGVASGWPRWPRWLGGAGHGTPKRALQGVDLSVQPGEVLAVVGGSGCGKTTLGRAIAGLVAPAAGTITFAGHLVGARRGPGWAQYRQQCQMVFQDPYSSLDPRMTVGALIGEALRLEPALSKASRQARVLAALEEVGLRAEHAGHYPHELSGGQRQRVAIARAVVRRPRFVIADEPVSALDMTVQAQILALIRRLQQQHGFACLFISHDLGVVEQVADRVVVMESGRIVEEADRDTLFDQPRHPCTRRLLAAIPALVPTATGGVELRWRHGAQGTLPGPSAPEPLNPSA